MIFRIIGEKYCWENTVPTTPIREGDLLKYEEADTFRQIGDSETIINALANYGPEMYIDTETTGLKWMKNDRIFSIAILGSGDIPYYINFQDYSNLQLDAFENFNPDWVFLSREKLNPIFEKEKIWVGHNLKFDHHMLKKEGFHLKGTLLDTMITERLISNDEFRYSLEMTVKRHLPNAKKDDAVEKYIDEHGLYNMEEIAGKKGLFKNKYYSFVPFRIIAPYAVNDVYITKRLFNRQADISKEIDKARPQEKVIKLESDILRICCEIEEHGVLIDKDYCYAGLSYEHGVAQFVEVWFKEKYGKEFIDSSKELAPLFKELGFDPPITEKNNESISGDFLEAIEHELAKKVLSHRESSKRANTYFRSFLALADQRNVLHADMKQTGTRTGRFSYSDPNLQNIPNEDSSKYPIRRALIPRPGHFFVMIDYAQQEFRMMLDYAKEMPLIEKIKEGHDPHQATADLTGLTRKAAKSLNFGLMYGMGIQKLANQIGVTYDEAKAFKQTYFRRLPNVQALIYQVTDVAKQRGCVYTWLNRKLDFKNSDFAYKAINGIIQGGCADVTKLAMVEIDRQLKAMDMKTKMLLQIHDELLFEVPFDEVCVVKLLQQSMEQAYPHKHIPLTTSLSYSVQSFHDAIEVKDYEELEKAIREHLSKTGKEVFGGLASNVVCENTTESHSGNT